jgi:hypothetical protein
MQQPRTIGGSRRLSLSVISTSSCRPIRERQHIPLTTTYQASLDGNWQRALLIQKEIEAVSEERSRAIKAAE